MAMVSGFGFAGGLADWISVSPLGIGWLDSILSLRYALTVDRIVFIYLK